MRACSLKLNRSALALAAATLLGGLLASPAKAANCTWNPAAGNWNVAASWSCGFVPGNLDLALIASGRTVTVTGAQPTTTVNNSGTVAISDNSSLGLTGSNTNNGLLSLNSGGNATDLTISGVVSLSGSGTVSMNNNSNNRIYASGGASALTIGAGQTVQGAGQVGIGSALALVNNGTIASTLSAGMTISSTAGVTNNNVLRADGGTLRLQNTAFNQGASGTLNAINGSVVQISNSSITGGSFSSGSGGAVATAGGTFANTVSGVTNTGTFNIVDNSGVGLAGTLTNNGAVNLQSGGNATDLRLSGSQSIVGTGVINLTNTASNRIYGTNATLTLGSGQTVTGAGTLGAGVAGFALANQGTVIASSSAGMLVNASAGVTNTGTLRADGGNLSLQTTVNSGGGAIEARNGSQVLLLNGAVVNNANFSASNGGLITTAGGATVTLGGGMVAGPMTVADNSFLRLTGDLAYNGTLTMDSGGNTTDLILVGARTISGAATIQMSNTLSNRLRAANASGDTLTLGSGVTLQGAGQLGTNTALAVTNNGTIIATSGAPLRVETTAGLTNNGVMRADGGTLQFGNVVVNSAGGSIEARNGSQVQLLNGTTINNANFSAAGAGSLITTVGGATVTLGGGTVAGPMTVADNSFLRLTGDLAYNGTLSMSSGGNVTDLIIVGARTISGTADITLSNRTNNRIYAANAADSLTFASGVTVQGAGSIGAGTATTVTNNGSWIANLSAGMALSTSGAATNNNLIRADGATFSINNTNLNQGTSGALNAINNGTVVLGNGSGVTGGTFSSANGGQILVTGGSTAAIANVTNIGTLTIDDNAFLKLQGSLTNNGVMNLQSGGNVTDLRIAGSRSIDGTGTINLSNRTNNRILAAAAGDSLTLGSGQTLQGAGQIGAGTQFNFTNNGTVVGSFNTPLTFVSSGAVTNNNAVRADAGTVVITGGTSFTQGAGGTLSAINAGVVQLGGNAVVSGGTLATTGSGQVTTVGGNTATVSNLTNAGTFNVVDNSFLRLQGTVNNTGTVNVVSGGNITDLRIVGMATLAGSGTTTLSNSANNRIVADAAGAQLTVGAGQTVQGAGQIGAGGGLSLVNRGTVTANQSNALNVAMSGGVQNAAGGLMQATTGTLNISNALLNNGTLAANGGTVNASGGFNGSGTVLISGAGQMNVGAPSSTGTLTHNGSAAAALALGIHSLTVNSDYTNASAGSGNSFNRRANVTGTGQILAGGNAAQLISGAGVTGGGASNATLTIGNLRVGANTYNVNIGNSGGTGPALRGAIQTNVNGGNITDTRLSGSGVTAGNYNAGGPGGAGSNQVITFTAASAGALAPLNSQAINLRSNFDNIADQRLNIVLAGNAAAYNVAAGSVVTPVQVANQRVGGSGSATLAISNTAAAGSFSEDLNASIGSVSGQANATGSVNGRLAGTGNTGTGAITVGVNTAAAGAQTGVLTLNYQTAGTVGGISNGLGVAAAGSQAVAVNGNVYQAAAGQLISSPLNFGTVQVGQVVSQNLVVRNTASGAAGFVEDLQASFGAASGTGASFISGTGSLNGIRAGSNSNASHGTMTVIVNTGAAGTVSGSIAVNYTSAGAVAGVSNGLGTLGVGSDAFGVQGQINATANVINQASPVVNNLSINLGAVRVGAAAPSGTVSVTNAATVAPQAALNASMGATTGPATASGSFNQLLPGATNNGSLLVGLNTATAGNFTGGNAGAATIQFVSDASNVGGCAPNCQLNLASQVVNVEGKVYTQAVGTTSTPALNFGIVRVGDTVSAQNIVINNSAAVTALNDTLSAGVSGVSGPFSSSSGVTGVVAGGSGNVGVSLNTASAGVFTQTALVAFTSQNADMTDIAAGADASVSIAAQVNNLANAVFTLAGGAGSLSQTGSTFYLDYGNLAVGDTFGTTMALANDIAGPADDLRGSFDTSGAAAFSLAGWGPFSGLMAGSAVGGLNLNYLASSVGAFTQSIFFNGFSVNASDLGGISQNIRLVLRGNVLGSGGGGTVPEPGSLSLVLLAVAAAGWSVRRRSAARAGAGQ